MRKNIIGFITVLCMIFSLSSSIVNADGSSSAGKCGTKSTWAYDTASGTLTISGTGAVNDFSDENAPWEELKKTCKNIVIDSGITSIGAGDFSYCAKVITVTIPDTVTSLGDSAFFGCDSLKSVYIPASVLKIGENAFTTCQSLASFDVDAKNKNFTAADGVLFNNDKTKLIAYPPAKVGVSYNMPNSVTDIVGSAFALSQLQKISMDDELKTIGDGAFYGCSLLSDVVIPENVISIGEAAFDSCEALRSVSLPENVSSLGDGAFSSCTSLEKFDVSTANGSYISIDGVLFNKAFTDLIAYPAGKKDTSYTVPDGITYIIGSAFTDCAALQNVIFPSALKTIGNFAFKNCTGLSTVTFSTGLKSIGKSAFYFCPALTSLNIPAGVTSIGDYAFDICEKLTDAVIPEGIYELPICIFSNCKALTSVTIPKSVTKIDKSAFFNCSALKNVNYAGTADDWKKIVIGDLNEALTYAYSSASPRSGNNISLEVSGSDPYTVSVTDAGGNIGTGILIVVTYDENGKLSECRRVINSEAGAPETRAYQITFTVPYKTAKAFYVNEKGFVTAE